MTTPEETMIRKLTNRNMTITAAESCTGGLISSKLTDIPGASKVFHTGLITYANESKTKWLGVSRDILAKHGAVSRETVTAMVKGAAKATGADVAVAVSGIAGPDGGTPDKPAGTVWTAVLIKTELHVEKFYFTGGRIEVRKQAAGKIFEILNRLLAKYNT